MENIIITNKENTERKIKQIKKEGPDKLHFLSDFDRTLTYSKVGREKVPSLISILRDKNYLDEDYSKRAKELFIRYHPYEIDPGFSRKERSYKMKEWWTLHKELLIEKGIKKNHFKKIAKDKSIKLRNGVNLFLEKLSEKNIPIIIFSASGCGEAVEMFFEERKLNYSNVYFLVNRFEWDNEERAINFKTPLIHPFNKNEKTIQEIDWLYKKIKKRKNVVLLGDSIADVEMIEGFEYNILLKVGFYNKEYNKKEEKKYKEVYDIILTNDIGFNVLYEKFFKKII